MGPAVHIQGSLAIHRTAGLGVTLCLPSHSQAEERQGDSEAQFMACYFQMKRLPYAS